MTEYEKMTKQFLWGMSILTAYLQYNGKENLTDIHILSENSVRDLLNILFDLTLEKAKRRYAPGYDLIDKKNKLVVQVSAVCTMQKVAHTIEQIDHTISSTLLKRDELEQNLLDVDRKKHYLRPEEKETEKARIRREINDLVDISGYKLKIFFLCPDTNSLVRKRGADTIAAKTKGRFSFNLDADILCFADLIRIVSDLSIDNDSQKTKRLLDYMERNSNLFIRRVPTLIEQSNAEIIVQEYAKNFCEPLFLHRHVPQTRVTLKNLFVEPSFLPLDGHMDCPKNIIQLLDAFLWGNPKDRLLFIDGDAAIGKTSLISWLCYHYTNLDEIGKSIFLDTPLVCIRLRDISLFKNETAEECILRYFSISSLTQFEEHYKNALIILEGADELGLVGGIGSLSVEQFILDIRHAFFNHKIVVTSRPKFINMDSFSGAIQSFTYRHISLSHFSAKKRICWINNYEDDQRCGEQIPETTKQYINDLSDEEAAGVADTPLALYLLVACEITASLKNNKWALYHEIFHNAIRSTPYNESFHIRGDVTSHLALRDEQFAETIYHTIERIAYKMFQNTKNERYYISSTELGEIVNSLNVVNKPEQANAIRKCCVLCAYWKESSNYGALEFYHNDIRDFFLCEYIYHRFFKTAYSSDPEEIIRVLIEISCEVFQFGVIAQTTWAQTFSFLYDRIRYENYSETNDFSFVIGKIGDVFQKAIYNAVNKDVMWKHSFVGSHYESVKTTFFNFVLFLKTWATGIMSEVTETFSSDSLYDIWNGTGVFNDWIDIFKDCIEISGKRHIAIGSQAHFLNKSFLQKHLSKACFEEALIENTSFAGSNLSNASFKGSTLRNVDFSMVNLSDTDFTNATLVAVDLSSAVLTSACFSGAVFRDVIWPSKAANMNHADFSSAQINNACWKNMKFTNAVFNSAVFDNCILHKLEFSKCLKNVRYSNCKITNCVIDSAHDLAFLGGSSDLRDIQFRGEIDGCSFMDLMLSNCSWTNAKLNNLDFINTSLYYADFRGASVRMARFQSCTFEGSLDVHLARLSKSVAEYFKTHAKNIVNASSVVIVSP